MNGSLAALCWPSRAVRRVVTIGTLCVLYATITGCSVEESPGAVSQPHWAEEPTFSGPYASELLNDYRLAPTGFAQDAIADGVISDAERAEGKALFASCLTEIGVTLTRYDDVTGSYDIRSNTQEVWNDFNDSQSKQAQECYMDSGFAWVDSLYLRMRSNPENADENKLIFECLLNSSAVPKGYTWSDFEREYVNREGVTLVRPELEHSPTGPLQLCENDPLGIVR